ncbi:MAG: hypothetical protein ACR2GF_03815 [Acidimicrobiales bacterium]
MEAARRGPGLIALTPDDAVEGWRYWQVRGGRLRSVTQGHVEWGPGQILAARCTGTGHRAPDEGCECGVYGARDLEHLRQHGLCLAPAALVVGRVALWGRVLDEVSGWRAELARPLELAVVPELVVGAEEVEAMTAALEAYRVPVGTMALADAVAGVSAAILANQAMAARASGTLAG